MENEKNETTSGFYLGRELFREGSKNGKAWKMYKLKFKPKADSQKSFSMTVFNEAKAKGTKLINELQEGQQYKIIYSEKDAVNNQGMGFVSKTAFGFYHIKEGEEVSNQQTAPIAKPQAQAAISSSKLDLSKFDVFKQKYIESVQKAGMQPNPVHMLGSFIAHTERERVAELIEKCKEALK